MGSFERFAAWRVGYDLTLKVYETTDAFPSHERFGLVSQMRRAAFSVVANIAEGAAKRGPREFARFLDIAVGSLTELEVALRLARDRKYLSSDACTELEALRSHAGILTWRLYCAMRRRSRSVDQSTSA